MSNETEEEKTKWAINALERPDRTWRTLEAVSRDLNLPLSEVQEIIRKLGSQVIKKDYPSAKGLDLYTTEKHYKERNYGKNEQAKSGEKQKVFISYSNIDEEFVRQLTQTLDEIEIDYFLDRKDINWGDHITSKVLQGISECSAIVVIISPASLKSQWVPFETGHAMGARKKVLPLLTHHSLEVPLYLRDFLFLTDIQEVKRFFQNNTNQEQ